MATQQTRSMVSETAICNLALSWVGADRIVSMDDPSEEGEWCRDNYPFIRDAVLEERLWSFAAARKINTTGSRDEWDVMFKHAVPLDWLGVFRVYRDNQGGQTEWEKEGRYVLSEDSTVYMWGTKRIVDTGYFSAMFVQTLAARLAAEMAIPLTESIKLQDSMWKLYVAKVAEATNRDAQQGRNEHVRKGKMTSSRGSRSRSRRRVE